MQLRAFILAAVLMLAPLCARGADLVVWWHKGFYPQEDEAVREIIAAFEQQTGQEVELVLQPQEELRANLVAAIEAGQPPDFAFSSLLQPYVTEWVFEDRLVDLTDASRAERGRAALVHRCRQKISASGALVARFPWASAEQVGNQVSAPVH